MEIKNLPNAEELKREALGGRFFGRAIADLDRDELLILIGFLEASRQSQVARAQAERSFLQDVRRHRYR